MGCNGRYVSGWATDTPHVNENAKPDDMEEVKGATVVRIENGYYRGARFSGVFEVAKPRNPFWETTKGQRVFVKAYWFCHKPPTSWPAILLSEPNPKIEYGYTGKVVRNIGT